MNTRKPLKVWLGSPLTKHQELPELQRQEYLLGSLTKEQMSSNPKMVELPVSHMKAQHIVVHSQYEGAPVAGQPTNAFIPHKAVLSPSDKLLYISYANASGPYDGSLGTVNKYNITSGVWTDISPTPLSSTYYGYGGLTVDLQKPGTLMVAALNQWWPDATIWRSTNSGATVSELSTSCIPLTR